MAKPIYDYAVAGAGVFGAWLARALHRRGRRVILLDPYGPASARASSGGETRIIRMGYGAKEIYTRWAWEALGRYRKFYESTDPTLLQTTGLLWMCEPKEEFSRQSLATFAKLGIPHEKMGRGEMERRFPQIDFGPCTWGVWEPDAAGLLARRGVQMVVRELVRQGLTYSQEAIAGPGGMISAGTYIFACGPWLPKLFPDFLRSKIRPTRQEVLYFGTPPGDPDFRSPRMPCWVDAAAGMYGLPDIESRGFKVAIDGHGPLADPDTQARLVPEATVAQVRGYLRQRFPRLAEAPVLHAEVCQYENTGNGDYLIDRYPGFDNVWLLGGGSGHGYKHGPVIGEYLAAALEDGAPIDPMFSLAAKPDYSPASRASTIPPK